MQNSIDRLIAGMRAFAERLVKALAAEPCGRTLRLFDGKQRYDLDFGPGAPAKTDAREQRLGLTHAVHCSVRFREVAGFKKKPPTERNQGLKHPIAIGFARVGENGPWVVSSAQANTPLGDATIPASRAASWGSSMDAHGGPPWMPQPGWLEPK